jgi:hypothetical protein
MNTRKALHFVFALIAGLVLTTLALSVAHATATTEDAAVDLAVTLKTPAHVATDSPWHC